MLIMFFKRIQLLIEKINKLLCPQEKYADFLKKRGYFIGNECEIYKTVNFGSEPYLITIGNHVRLNDGVQLITHEGGFWVLRKDYNTENNIFKDADKFGKIKIGNNVHVGTNAIIMPDVTIGDNSIIGCGAIVTHDVEQNSVVVGVPARKIESIDEFAAKNIQKIMHTKNMSAREKEIYLKKFFSVY